jgi:hypothetical protein
MAERLRATTSFIATVPGAEHLVHQGDELPALHPAVRARRELFEPKATSRRREAAEGRRRDVRSHFLGVSRP